jgi:hypothetical protein
MSHTTGEMKATGRRLSSGTAIAAVLAVSIVLVLIGVASAEERVAVRSGNVESTLSVGFFPKAASKTVPTPVGLTFSSRTNALDGTHPPALSELVLRIDRSATIDVKGLPACNPFIQYQAVSPVKAEDCRGAIVGRGKAGFEIAFPGEAAISTEGELTVLNGGARAGVTTLYAITYLTVPTPAAIIAKVKIRKIHDGRLGTEAIVSIPKVAGGSGSLTSLSATIHREFSHRGATAGVVTLKCADGKTLARADELFADGTHLEARLARPCVPSG